MLEDDCHTLRIDRLHCRGVRALGTTSVGQHRADIVTSSQYKQSLD